MKISTALFRLFKKITYILFAAILLLAAYGLPSFGQTKVLIDDPEFAVDARAAIDSLYNRKPEAANTLMEPWEALYSDHPIWKLWEGMELWWNVLEDLQDTSLDTKFISTMQHADYMASGLLRKEPRHPDALIIRAVANGYVARLHANREDWITSVQIGRRAYQAHQELVEVAPDLPDNQFAEGIKLYYSDYIQETYPAVRAFSWFFPEGNRKEGINTLISASENGVFARPEAIYFLGNIFLHYEQDYRRALRQFDRLIHHFPSNGYYRRQYLRALGQLGHYTDIHRFVENTRLHWGDQQLKTDPVLEFALSYWRGRADYQMGEWSNALQHFEHSRKYAKQLKNNKKRDLYILGAYYSGRILENLNRPEESVHYYSIASDQSLLPVVKKRSRARLKSL